MPYRQSPLVTDEIYHVFNRSIARQPIFPTAKFYQRALSLLSFYRYLEVPYRFSHFNRLPLEDRQYILSDLVKNSPKLIETLAFCFMPNHIHFLFKQSQNNGIATFMSKFQNSYAKYFNIVSDRIGSLFQSMFKAVRIETDEQLLHVVRYIHLNPYTSYVVDTINDLENYPWSSFTHYFDPPNSVVDTELVLNFYPSTEEFKRFTYDQANYQRQLGDIKHLLLE